MNNLKLTTTILIGLLFNGCSIGSTRSIDSALANDESRTLKFSCSSPSRSDAEISLKQTENAFDFSVVVNDEVLFELSNQRPALGARVEDGDSETPSEFVEFNVAGLETIPVEKPHKVEIELGTDSQTLQVVHSGLELTLKCSTERRSLLSHLGILPIDRVDFAGIKAVGFDIDDTLMFTSPAFTRGFAAGGFPSPNNEIFWSNVNQCDPGCEKKMITLPDGSKRTLPANEASTPKTKAMELVQYHKSQGHRVYAITARPEIKAEALRKYVSAQMGIATKDIYFEPDINQPGNPAGKTDRIEKLNLDIFYGDSDSDVTDTLNAFSEFSGDQSKKVRAVRFLRSPKSSNRKAGKLNKYHPGYFGEPIIADSY